MEKEKFVGISKVGEKGQIVIPKEVRDMFDIKPGDSVIVLCDKNKGIALSREKIITNVWGYDFYGNSRTERTGTKPTGCRQQTTGIGH